MFVNIIRVDSTHSAACTGAGDVVWELGKIHTAERYYLNCLERFSRYKAPKKIAITDQLPLSPAGKVLRREVRRLLKNRDEPDVA